MKLTLCILLVCLAYVAAEKSACQKNADKIKKLKEEFHISDLVGPSCNPDGTYAARQCSPMSKICRCSDRDGNTIGTVDRTLPNPKVSCDCLRKQADAKGDHKPVPNC